MNGNSQAGFATAWTRAVPWLVAVVCGMSAALPAPIRAQVGGSPPRFSLTLTGGAFVPTAGGDLFEFFKDRLTLMRGDLRGVMFQAEGGAFASERVEVLVGVDYARSKHTSRFRGSTGSSDGPIVQTTRLTTGPGVLAGVRLHLTPRSSPAPRLAPFASLGGGWLGHYELDQSGDFYDERQGVPFGADLRSAGRTSFAFVGAGVDAHLDRLPILTGRIRYRWADTRPTGDYHDFASLDLSGFTFSVGVTFRR